MKIITLKIENAEEYQQILEFVKKLGVQVSSEEEEQVHELTIQEKLRLLEKSSGTIKHKPVISLESLRRENLYDA